TILSPSSSPSWVLGQALQDSSGRWRAVSLGCTPAMLAVPGASQWRPMVTVSAPGAAPHHGHGSFSHPAIQQFPLRGWASGPVPVAAMQTLQTLAVCLTLILSFAVSLRLRPHWVQFFAMVLPFR